VPRLEVGGANWVIFKDRLLWAADAKGVLGHLDRTSKEPEAPAPRTAAAATAGDGSAGGAAGQTGQATAETPDPAQTKYDTDIVEWRKREATAKQLVASTIPDSLFMKVRGRATAWAIWEAIAAEFEKKSRMFTVNLWRRLQDLRCGEKDDVRTHFAKMRTIHEDLAAMGQPPSEDDFYAIILGSMPPSYEPYLSALSAAMRATDKLLSPDDLMDGLTEEYERQLLRSRGGQSRDATDVALTAND
ncbi:uncharacterized protein TRAVEDRAFT_92309, partial [Trametes versicolor FP-101664 SS1]|uniref:uncharacterized protein n=1 Tax=Trametes versicolor (strain FP-101664) TaxID=717944 RepID=UPI0004623695